MTSDNKPREFSVDIVVDGFLRSVKVVEHSAYLEAVARAERSERKFELFNMATPDYDQLQEQLTAMTERAERAEAKPVINHLLRVELTAMTAERDALQFMKENLMLANIEAVNRENALKAKLEVCVTGLERVISYDKRLPDFTDNPQTISASEALAQLKEIK